MSINVLKPKYRVQECLAEIKDCLERGWTGMGYKTTEFENQWKEYTGLPNAHYVNSGTSALHLAVAILRRKHGWSKGDEIITTPLTFVSTNHVILYEGLVPVFADIDETLCLSPEAIQNSITPKTKAVMYVGIGGNTGHLNKVRMLCKKHDLILILDAAHMSGTRYFGTHVGGEADASIFSFHSVKNLPTADSGMICFRDTADDIKARELSWLGISLDTYQRAKTGSYKWEYDVSEIGFKYHGNSIMASIGLVQLRHLDEDNTYRRKLATIYRTLLKDNPNIGLIPIPDECETSAHLFQIRVADRPSVIDHMNSQGINPGVHYKSNNNYSVYTNYPANCPMADKVSNEIISLPLHLDMTRKDVKAVCNALVDIVKGG